MLSKNVYKFAKNDFAITNLIQKIAHEVETPWLSGKKTVPGAAVSKEGHSSGA